ncbi:HET-domain-containing protein [Polyplosphaeria fusca]|uniref:HET-domain-containing protein n=1 Tax=Polyplosphaeria fusca TaxID=682080 RepID=A0A9P4R1V1_9PLEO|nr:HET-domain-containing protein [Polyplosphaeria fusca]
MYICKDIPTLREIPEYFVECTRIEVVDSARGGCALCTAIISVLRAPEGPYASVRIARRTFGLLVKESTFYKTVPILFAQGSGDSGSIPKSVVFPATGLSDAFLQASQWLENCLNNHGVRCNALGSMDRARLPFRILDIDLKLGDTVVLLESGLEEERHGIYACLSHCWGENQPIMTTISTLQQHQQGIFFSDLPATFQDAISILRQMDVKYLWIDSLCIVQDDALDWETQSAQMADIYRNEIITISAAASNNSHGGLFRDEPSESKSIEVTPCVHAAQDVRIFARQTHFHNKEDHPLIERGWVYQERLLSPRVLHFGAEELIWECMTESSCQCGEGVWAVQHNPWVANRWYNSKSQLDIPTLLTLPLQEAMEVWRGMVQDYSKTQLSHPDDIFPAITGAAKVISESLVQRGFDSTYIADLWRHSFLEDCLWTVSNVPGSRPLAYRAPTFSWASIVSSGGISYEDIRFSQTSVHLAVLLDYRCELRGIDDMGQLLSAHVSLQGSLMPAQLKISWNSTTIDKLPWRDVDNTPHIRFDGDCPSVLPGSENACTNDGIRKLSAWCLPILFKPGGYNWSMYCLIIKAMERNQEVVYERLGLLELWDRNQSCGVHEDWFDPSKVVKNAIVKIM